MALTLNESVFDKVKDFFGKTVEGEAKESIYNWIQIFRQQCLDKKYVHYELINNHVELHFEIHSETEDYRKDKDVRALIDYLKGELKEDNKYKWGYWEWDGKYYRCQYEDELNEENYLDVTKEFIEKIDSLIEKFKNNPGGKKEIETTEPVTLVELPLKDVFNLNLTIPDYQRIYCWEDKQVNDLWRDLVEMPNEKYHLGAIILHKNKEGEYNIVDGQQRLVTLTILLQELSYWGKMPLLEKAFNSGDARLHIANTKAIIGYKKNDINVNDKEEFIEKIIQKILFSVLVLKDTNLDLAYTFFSNQNAKGVPLSDYDLLKAHHLRYIHIPEEQEHLAKQWNKIIKDETLSRTLGTHIYRLRKWMRKHDFDEGKRLRVRDEYSAAPIMDGIPPFGEKFDFYEKIQGGSHFFAYANHFIYQYEEFSRTIQKQKLVTILKGESHWRYASVIETFLFGYFLKFGCQYMSEALFCITGIIAGQRYRSRADMNSILVYANLSEMVMMIDQATSPTFFFAEAMANITVSGKSLNEYDKKHIKGRFYNLLKNLFNSLDDFSDKTIINKKRLEYENN